MSISVEDCHSVHQQHRRRGRTDGMTHTLEDMQPPHRRRKVTIEHLLAPHLTFYPSADIKPYALDLQYEQVKSYSKEDYNDFSKTMYLDVVRIMRHVQSNTTSKQSILRSIKNDIILSEEVRGIEHLLMHKTFSNTVYQARRNHVRVVLSEQTRIEKESTQMKIEDKEYLSEMLAQFSISRSSESVMHARIRAYTCLKFDGGKVLGTFDCYNKLACLYTYTSSKAT
jgi:hypothetical protein